MPGSKYAFIPDQPSDTDHLDFDPYVNTLAEQLTAPETQTPMTLGVFGTWGSGKTTLLKLIEKKIADRKKAGLSYAETLWVNVWQLSSQSELWHAFLQSLFTQVHKKLPLHRRLAFDWELFRERVDWGELARQLLTNSYRIVIVITPLLLALLWPKVPQGQAPSDAYQLLGLILNPITGGSVSLILGLWLLLKPIIESAKEKVSIDLGKVLKEAPYELQVSALQQLQGQFENMVRIWVGEKGRLIIFIDDLDRCSPDKVVEVFEALKLFATTQGCIYVLGVDQQVVARSVQVRYKDFGVAGAQLLPVDGMRYIEKIIQLPFLLPLVETNDITGYLKSFDIDWPHPGCVDTFARGLPPNPRQVKRAINVFMLLWRLAEYRKTQKKMSGAMTALRLAKVVAIQTAFPDTFEQLRENPELLKDLEAYCLRAPDEQKKLRDEGKLDPILADLVKRPLLVALFGLQRDDPLALFSRMPVQDLRVFFSLAGQIPVADAEKLKEVAPNPLEKNPKTEGLTGTEKVTAGEAVISGSVISGDRTTGGSEVYATSPIPVASINLHQLPPPPRDFVGREAEIAQILNAVREKKISLIGLQGRGGVGKTAVALLVAERLREQYPDAQLYFDLRGASEPVSATGAMGYVIRTYRPEAKLPESDADIRGLYLTVLHNQRALLVMDNVVDAEQVQALIPPPSCLLIITSRQHFELEKMEVVPLDTLAQAEASALLIRIAPRLQPDQAEKIIEVTGSLPLALRLAGSMLVERADLSPEAYIERLQHSQNELQALDASLALSFEQLLAPQQRLICQLAVFPADFDARGAAAIWNLPVEQASEGLAEFARYSLLNVTSPNNRYHLDIDVRRFVGARLEPRDRAEVALRHATQYEVVLREANTLYLQGGETTGRGLALFDVERVNILAGKEWAEANFSASPQVAQLVARYVTAGVDCIGLRLTIPERLQWFESALAVVQQLNDQAAIASAVGNLAIAYAENGDYQRAIDYHERALGFARIAGDRFSEAAILGNLSLAYMAIGNFTEALTLSHQHLAIAKELGDKLGQSKAYSNLGNACAAIGQLEKAQEYYGHQQALSSEIGDRRGEGAALTNIGNLELNKTNWEMALKNYQAALQIFHDLGDASNEATLLGNLGNVSYLKGDLPRAIEFYGQALQLARQAVSRPDEANALWNIGLAYKDLGENDKAVESAKAALEILEQSDDPNIEDLRQQLAEWEKGVPIKEGGSD